MITDEDLAGTVIGVVVGLLSDAPVAVLAAIATTETIFVVAGWAALWPMNAGAVTG